MSADYKQKYLDLRSKLMEVADTSFRLGFEQGMKEGMIQQMQQQMQQQAEQQAAMEQQMAQGQMPPGAEGEMSPEEQAMMEQQGGAPMEGAPEEMGPEAASELDQHIEELESLVAKGEKPSVLSMRKAVEELVSLRKAQKEKMSKKMQATVTSQKKFVDGILKKWEEESKDSVSDLEKIIEQHEVETEK